MSFINNIVDKYKQATSILDSVIPARDKTYSIENIINMDRPATTFRWACFMPENLEPYGGRVGETVGKLEKEYVSSCEINLPLFSSVGSNTVVYSHVKYLEPKKPELGTMTIEFYESFYYPVLTYFKKWDDVCCSTVGTFKPLKAKVGKIVLEAFDIEDDTSQLTCEFYVIPTSNLTLRFNGESDRQKPKIEFKILQYKLTDKDAKTIGNEISVTDIISYINKFF